jgi:LmbE family N-acetylglucosaminyl deacetylase
MRRVALGFFAHPDDAEFLCSGTLMRLGALGWELHIATATHGDCGSMIRAPDEIAAIRTREAEAAAALVGARFHCLGELDARVCYDKPTVQKAIDLFRGVAPSLVFTHAPSDYMVDHEIVAQLARGASFIYGAPNCSKLARHPESVLPHLYFCDPFEGIDALGRPVVPTTVIDVTAQMPKRVEMLACHASQREWLRAHHGVDEYIDSMRRHAAARGTMTGVAYAEAFVQQRSHAFPRNDLLSELFGTGARKP